MGANLLSDPPAGGLEQTHPGAQGRTDTLLRHVRPGQHHHRPGAAASYSATVGESAFEPVNAQHDYGEFLE